MKGKLSQLLLSAGMACLLLFLALAPLPGQAAEKENSAPLPGAGISGPFSDPATLPTVFNGDLRDLPQEPLAGPAAPIPLRYQPGTEPKGSAPQLAGWRDPIIQDAQGPGQMPDPIANFAGMSFIPYGAGWPPDTNGDVGPNHYMQTVNTSVAIYDKTTGALLSAVSFNTFFQGPAGTPCDSSNDGDPVVIYDPLADRWIVTDFAWFNFNTGPYYECIAVSQGPNPVTDGWYFYALRADTGVFTGYLNDYPKLGVWPDGWYMSANMFQINPPGDGFGVRVWALDRASMLGGGPANEVHFDLCTSGECGALLPSNLRGDLPPADSPNFFMTTTPPNLLQMWLFSVDWAVPANSTFTGPIDIPVADFVMAQSVPQLGTSTLLDSLSFRPMMQLQYRQLNGTESLWLNHTIAAGEGVGGVRWYEVQDPNGTPTLVQQSTFQPDDKHRWMGSLAVDQDGNMALGYSVSNSSMYPAIRYAGRLDGEAPGLLTQAEAVLIQGTGAQSGIDRWGDYSAMTVDPVDDCTFWYTTEYYLSTGTNWQTRIGSFRFPSCGQPKAYLDGTVYNAVTGETVAGMPVTASSITETFTALTDSNGTYTMSLLAGTYDITAGPLLPGYPVSSTVNGVATTAGNSTTTDFWLSPVPFLEHNSNAIDDSGPFGNGNGFPEPGEQGLLLWEGLHNGGAITATNVSASLASLTAGVTVDVANAAYADIAAGSVMTNVTAYAFSIDSSVACGSQLDLQQTVTSNETTPATIDLSFQASVPQPPQEIFNNDVESGANGWTTGGTGNTWAITTLAAHSPTHSWTDSPGGNYNNNVNSYLRTPALDLTGKTGVVLSGWYLYGLENGFDYVYLEYSLNGGTTWEADPLTSFNGHATEWTQVTVDAAVLDNQSNVALRYHLVTDAGVVDEGIFLDDVVLSYQPIVCDYAGPVAPDAPALLSPADGSTAFGPDVLFAWQPAGTGGAASSYELELDGSTALTVTAPLTSTTLSLASGAHTWRVRAVNDAGTSPYSDLWTVTVVNAPDAPTLLSPADGSSAATPLVTFVWQAAGTGDAADSFALELDGSTTVTVTAPLTSTTLSLASGSHTWRVRAANGAGASPYSPSWTVIVPYWQILPAILKP